MLEVGQINVDDTVEAAEGFDGFITGGIPDQGNRRPPERQSFEDLRNERRGGDEGNRVHAEVLQALQGIRKLRGRERPAFIAVGNVAVLAVDTAQGAAGEEDGSGAVGAGDRGLFPVMRSDPGDEHLTAQAAETKVRGAIRVTPTGA